MNEFEKLEAELKELRPLEPSQQFTARLEKALGDAGNVAMRCLPDDEVSGATHQYAHPSPKEGNLVSFPRLLAFAGLAGTGLAAVWAIIVVIYTNVIFYRNFVVICTIVVVISVVSIIFNSHIFTFSPV